MQGEQIMQTLPLNKIPGRLWWDHFLAETSTHELLFRTGITPEEENQLFKRYVCIVNIETSTYCNRKCAYCPLATFDRTEKKYMREDLFEIILHDLMRIEYSSTVSLSLYNEPLANKAFVKKIARVRSVLPQAFIKFNSNGDFLDVGLMDKLADAGANAIFVTLHPPAGKKYDDEDRIDQFKKLFVRLNINFSLDEILPGRHIESNFFHNGMRVRVMADNWLSFGTNRTGTVTSLEILENRVSPCMRPFREFTISSDGSIWPCCQFFPDSESNKPYRVGRIAQQGDIFRLYASEQLAGWRRNLFCFGNKGKPCDRCTDPDFAKQETREVREAMITSPNDGR